MQTAVTYWILFQKPMIALVMLQCKLLLKSKGRYGPRGQNWRMARAVGEVPTTSLGSRQLDTTLVIGFEKRS